MDQLELILRRFKLDPFILQNENCNSLTIIEALEKHIYQESSFGIILMTEDDIGYAKKDGSEKEKPRARQNVILELGMLMGTLGRENIIILRQEGDLEEPSDIKDILTRRFKDHIQETCFDLAASLKKAGFDIDNESISRAAK